MNPIWWRCTLWLLGLALLAAGAVGARWVVHPRASLPLPGPPSPEEAWPPLPGGERFVIGLGHADVEPGVTGLNPTQLGRVREVLVKENQFVTAGTDLLRLDSEAARARVQEAEADLAAAQQRSAEARKLPEQQQHKLRAQQAMLEVMQSRVASARIALARKEQLNKSNLVDALEVRAAGELIKELEAAERAELEKLRNLESADPSVGVVQAEEEVKAKMARLEQARCALRECVLRAERDGTVLRVQVGPGDLITAQSTQPAILFCPAAPRIIRAEVEQEYADRVVVGQHAQIEDDSRTGRTWEGRVTRVSGWFSQRRSVKLGPLQFNDVRTLECIIEINPGPELPRIGQRVRVLLRQPS